MKIQILHANNERCTIPQGQFFRELFNFFARVSKDEPIEWTNDPCNVLAVTNIDLSDISQIPWADTNIIFAETCQQIYDLSYKLDYTKAYIFATESYADFEHLKEKFYGLPLIAHYAVFNEVFNYGYDLFNARCYLTTVKIVDDIPGHDYFCLIGRQSNLRTRFIYELAKQDLSNSLVKYNGKVVGNSGASPKFDRLDYKNGFFDTSSNSDIGNMLPSKLIQADLYNNFRAEIQFETDSIGGQGWDLIEYHVTEKTLKPLIIGKPCLMYGPVGYNLWLSQFDIDLGHGNFEYNYDSIEEDQKRACAVVEQIADIDWGTVTKNTQAKDKNLIGMHKLSELSKKNCLDFYRRIRAM